VVLKTLQLQLTPFAKSQEFSLKHIACMVKHTKGGKGYLETITAQMLHTATSQLAAVANDVIKPI